VGGKVASSSSSFNFARSKCCSTTNRSLYARRRPMHWVEGVRFGYETRSESPAFQENRPHV
jgi:hypothetical protein